MHANSLQQNELLLNGSFPRYHIKHDLSLKVPTPLESRFSVHVMKKLLLPRFETRRTMLSQKKNIETTDQRTKYHRNKDKRYKLTVLKIFYCLLGRVQ